MFKKSKENPFKQCPVCGADRFCIRKHILNQVKNVSKSKTDHPCQMPLEVMENIIKLLPEDKIIVDPFAGSGTTGVACINTNRNYILIEKEPEYIDIINKRLKPSLVGDNVEKE